MARNGSGTYTKAVSDFSPGGTITASDHNNLWNDAATELTNSVAADGQTSMTGPLKHSSGSKAAPSLTFASDTDSGLYLSSANEVSIVASASQVAIFAASAAQINVPTLFISTVTLSATATFTTGFIASQTCSFSHPVLMSGTATFTNGFLASNTCSFSHPILCSGTATFTRGFIASATCVFVQPILCSGTATFTNGFIASATSTFTIAPISPVFPKAIGVVTYSGSTPTLVSAKSFNMASVTDTAVGRCRFNFTNAMADANYVAIATPEAATGTMRSATISEKTTGYVIVDMMNENNNLGDPVSVSVVVYSI